MSKISGQVPDVGSSYRIEFGSVTIARAKLTRFCMPPESSEGNLFSIPFNPTIQVFLQQYF